MLVGRREERATLEALLASAREGRSGVLVLQGEAGVGKSALLDDAMASADGYRVVRATGVQSEMELAFGALHQLCAPLLDRLDGLPPPQRDALGAAFGLSAGTAPERFLVGLATLSLLSATAEDGPLLCVVEDAHWLDRPSAQALAFVARRLLAEPVALLFATRQPSEELSGLPVLAVEGLSEADASVLLATALTAPLDVRVRDRIVAETRGNPLALLELPRDRTPAELAVGFGVPVTASLSGTIEESFARRAAQLPVDTQRLLLVAAADQLGDPDKVWRAAALLDVGPDAAAAASEAGLLDLDTVVRFRHPLVRSAVYRSAAAEERRRVHRALADATDAEHDPDRRAWHRAAASGGPDEEVAAELERSAGRAQVRGGLAAAAVFLERAADLTPDPSRQALRRLLGAGADLAAGANDRARDLLERSTPHLNDPAARAQAMRMDGAIRFADGRGGDTPALLYDAALALADLDIGLARETLFEAFEAAMWAGDLTTSTTMLDVAEAARELPAGEDAPPVSLLLSGYTERLTAGYANAVPWWRRAAAAPPATTLQWWHGMAWNATGELFDFRRHLAVGRLRVRLTRDEGALAALPVALSCLAWSERIAGRADTAESLTAEAREIAAASGIPAMPGAHELMHMAMLAWRGRMAETESLGRAVTADAITRGQGLAVTLAQFALTTLYLGNGRYEDARRAALRVFDDDPLYIGSIALADAVEATARSDDLDAAHAALERLRGRALASGTPWALGLLARAGALLADDEDAETLHREAIEQLDRAGVATDLARAHLLHGEWLRRQRRRRDARRELRLAYDLLEGAGALAFAQRAETELVATGGHARARAPDTRDELTPQEKQIATHAASGETNAEIAAQLFISPHTVAYHLRKVYAKLGIGSRSQLATLDEALPDATDELTAQEDRIARLAAEGASNAEIAAQLAISPHTVAYHLRKVFAKLDVASRDELGDALPRVP
jgi:DNA-binding CsgD family transcriptional regulator